MEKITVHSFSFFIKSHLNSMIYNFKSLSNLIIGLLLEDVLPLQFLVLLGFKFPLFVEGHILSFVSQSIRFGSGITAARTKLDNRR